jgi:mono/diheme cytochrome c family protein
MSGFRVYPELSGLPDKGIGYREREALYTSRSRIFGVNWETVEEIMAIRPLVLLSALLVIACVAGAGLAVDQSQLPPTYMPSGEQTYKQYCAACHGANAKGNGPLASLLKTPPSDLTTLAKRHLGKFPYDYVSSVLEFGPGLSAHGSSDMPTWGPIFRYFDKQNERVVQQRIKNLCNYLASLQGT